VARRRKQRADAQFAGCIVVAAAVLVPAVLLITFLANNPTMLVVLLASGGSLATWRISAARRRRKELAECQRRQYELGVIRSQEIAPYLSMNARQFEEAVAFLCGRDGCTGTRVVGGVGDLGADVIATTPSGHVW
jgi:restriction system protein